MTQQKYTDGSGVSEIWANTKNYIASQLLGYVTTDTTQTIDGTKTFIDSVFIKRSNPFLQIRSTGYVKGVAPSVNCYQGIRFYDDETSNSENHIVGGFETQYSTSGYNISNINCRNYNQNNVQLNYSVGLYVPNDSTRPIQFVPATNNIINLGSPSYQWNNTYTRHILIDNDINIWSSLINKSSNSGYLALRGGTSHSDGASLILYGKDYNNSTLAGAVATTAYGNSDYTVFFVYPNGTVSVYNNSTNTTKNLAMQEDVNTLLSGKSNVGHTHSYNDLTDKPTIPNVSNYYTKAEVDALISNAGISPSANTLIGEPYSLVNSAETSLGNYEEVSND